MYAITHKGKAYGPAGQIKDVEGTPLAVQDVDGYNKALEEQEIAHLETGPNAVFLYVQHPTETKPAWRITTWLGTVVCELAEVGLRRNIGFGWHTYRRAVTARIFGTLYHGWYMESSGQYCRLRKAKHQEVR